MLPLIVLPLKTPAKKGLRCVQKFSEVFRGFSEVLEGFSEVFQRPSQSPSQSAIFLSELRVVLPLIVLPLKTPAKKGGFRNVGSLRQRS